VRAVGGRPSSDGLETYIELEVRVTGAPDPRSGYLVSITDIDRAVRTTLPGVLATVPASDLKLRTGLTALLAALRSALRNQLGIDPSMLELRLTPFSSLSVDSTMPQIVHLTRRFDFCAAHRLALPELTDEENRRRFGKCSHPSGHGHNYRLDVTVSCSIGDPEPSPPWDAIVEREVVERYDHRHLNVDCPEFAEFNPSVEHIAKVIFDRLQPKLADAGVRLARVCVWETEKTWCAIPA